MWNCATCTLQNPMRRRRCEACGSRRLVDDTSAADTAVPATSSAAASAQRTDFEAAHEGTALLAAAAGAASNQAVGGRAKRKRPVVAGWLRQRKSKQPSSTTKNDATMTAIVERQSVRVRLTADYLLATQQCSPSSAASLDGNARAAPVVHQGKEDAQCTSAFLGGASGQRFASREYFPAEMPNSRCATNPISQGGIAAPFSPCDNDQATRIPPKAAHEGCSLREQVAAINTIVDAPRVLLPRVSRTTESDPSLRKENLALLCISLEDASQCPSESGVPFAETSALGTEPFAAQLDNSSPPNLSSPSFPRSNSCGGDVRVNDRGLRAESLPSPNQLAQNVSVAKESLTPAIGGDPDTKSEATTQSSGVVVEAPGTVTSITGFRCVPAKVTLPHESSLSSYSSVATQALAAKKKDFASMNLSLTKPPSGMLNDETHRSAADVLLVASHKNPPRDWGTEIHTGLETQQTYGNEQSRDDQSEKTGVAKSHQPPGDTGSLAVAAHRASTPPEHVGRSTGDAMGAGLCALALGTIPLGEEDEPENLSGSGDARDYPTGSKRSLHENVSPHYRFISAKTQNSTAMKKFRAMDRSDGCDFFYTPTTTQSQESLGRLSQQLDRTNSSSPAKLAVCDSASTAAHHTSPMRKLEQRAFGAPNVAQASSQLRSEHGAPSEKLPLPVAFTVPLPVAFTDSRRVDDRLCSTGRIGDANWSCDFERPSAMFQTGLGSRITIASASLARAVSIFGDSGGDFQVASIRSPVLPPTHPVVAFRTAGLKAALSVSAESMAKAEVISRRDLSAESSRRLSSQAQHTTEAALADKGGDDSHHTSILPAVEFHTAGLQTTISASAARLVLGEGLVADEDGETPSYKQTFVKATALPVVQGEKIAGCESAECSTALTSAVSVDLHNATEIASKANLYPAVFQAAGRSIAISAESMARADRIFAGRDGGDDSFQDFNDTVAPTTDAYLAQGAASDGSITFMTRRPCIAFRAGGRGAPISVSVESVANAKALFDSVRDPEVVVDLANQEKLTDCGCSSADSHPFSPRVCSETAGHVSAITESSVNLAGANRTINSNHMKQSSTITDTDIVSSPTIEKLFGSLSDENDITTTAVSACEAGKRVLREHPDFAGIQNTRVHTKARVSFGSAVKVDCRATFSDYEQSSSLRIQSLDSGAASPLSSLASASLAATSRDDLAYRHQTTIDYCDDQQFANTPVAGKNPDWRSSFRPFVTPGTVHCSRSQVSHLHRSPRTAERILGSQAPFDDIGVSELKRVKKSSCTMTEQDCRSADEVGRCANGSSKDEEAVATPFDPPDQIYPPTLRDAVASGFMVTKPVDCLRFGVSSTILSVTSINACGVRFDPFSLLPVSICDVDSADSVQVTGSLSDFRKAIVDFGCDDSSICARWLSNHVRWIIWKYASYERRFAPYLSGKCLTFKTVAHQLLHRYDREVRGGSRPAVRKVLNRDVSAHCMMILCVARIKRHLPSRKSEAKIGENDETVHVNDKYILELTDGWYSLPACPDTHLCAFIRNGTIKVGTKLLLSGAVLTGYDDGIDPLDRSFDPFKPGSSPVLQIAANSTRLARWDAKLGFVAPSIRNISHEGMLLVRRISDVLDGGGRVPLIDLRILHRYPLLYLGRHCGAEIGKARIFTEREEIARHEMQEKRRQNLAEKYSEEIEAECIEDIDEGAPDVWHRMLKDGSATFFDDLDDSSRADIDRWSSKRAVALQTRMQMELAAKLEELDFDTEPSIPFVKVLVASCSVNCAVGVDSSDEEAILTIWRPSNEQLDALTEGVVVRVKNIDTKAGRFDGRRQFSGVSSTSISMRISDPPLCMARDVTTLLQISLSSKRLWKDSLNKLTFDALGVILKVKEVDDCRGWWIYLTDESHLLLRVHVDADCNDLASFQSFSNGIIGHAVVGFRDLRTMPFDYLEYCAVAQYRGGSHFFPKPADCLADRLLQWSNSGECRDQLRRLLAYLDVGLQEATRIDSNCFKAIGYIADFQVRSNQPQLLVRVDCGGPALHTWKFPLALISSFAGSCQELVEVVVLNDEDEVKLTQLTSIGPALRARHNLYCFILRRSEGSLADCNDCVFEVSQISAVDTSALAALYSTLMR